MTVPEMRAEMVRLGHKAESKAAKRTAAVRVALELARANPRDVEEAAVSPVDGSGSSSDEESDGEALDGDDVYQVQAHA